MRYFPISVPGTIAMGVGRIMCDRTPGGDASPGIRRQYAVL
jgi:hypothetical protein